MIQSLMVGLNEKDMAAVVLQYNLKPFYYPTLFPLKPSLTLSWKLLEGQSNARIAGDVVSFGSAIPEKRRNVVSRIDGDIPKIAIQRSKGEEDINQYNIMLAMAGGDPNERQIIDFWAEDTVFCQEGVNAKLEWIALQQISNGGKVKFTTSNNASAVTQFDLDYQVDASRKLGFQTGSASWDSNTAKPITKDFKSIVNTARFDKNTPIYLKYAFMSLNTFANMVQTDEVIKMCASYLNNAVGLAQTPNIDQVNAALNNQAWLYGLQIIVIDQQITIESPDGTRTTANPFNDDVVTFCETQTLGYTYYAKLADESIQTDAIKVKNGHVLIKKFAEENPILEVTQGMANAFPAWALSNRSYFMKTNNNSWNL